MFRITSGPIGLLLLESRITFVLNNAGKDWSGKGTTCWLHTIRRPCGVTELASMS